MELLSARLIQDLLNYDDPAAEMLSLYLDLESGSPLHNFETLLAGALSKGRKPAEFAADLRRLRALLAKRPTPGFFRGLAAFSAGKKLWAEALLPQPVGNSLSIAPRPALAPLASLLDQYRRYGVALVDARKARLFEVFWGRIEPRGELRAAEAGPSSIQDPLQRHLRAAAGAMARLYRGLSLRHFIVAAPGLDAALLRHLPTFLQDTVIIDSQLSTASSPEEVLARVLAGERESRKVRESVLIFRLIDAATQNKAGVLGLSETLAALQRGQARMLLVRDGFSRMGRLCPSCRALALSGRLCLLCNKPTEPVVDVVAEMIRRALDQDCEVFRVLYDRRLSDLGGIGAELSFRQGAEAPEKRPAGAAL